MINHSLKDCRCIFHSKRHNSILIKGIWGAKGRRFVGAISKGNLPIPCQKIKLANRFCIANFINAIIKTQNRIRIRLCALINFSMTVTNLKELSGFGTRIRGELHSLLLGPIMLFSNIIFNHFVEMCSFHWVTSVMVLFNWSMVTHINVMISSISSLGLVRSSRRGQLDTPERIDAMGTTGFYFDHDAISSKLTLLALE